jgi:hypothetical protein
MIKIIKNSLYIPLLIASTCIFSLIACDAKQPSNDETPSNIKGNYLAYLSYQMNLHFVERKYH